LDEILAMIADGTFCALHPSFVELVFAAHEHPSAILWR